MDNIIHLGKNITYSEIPIDQFLPSCEGKYIVRTLTRVELSKFYSIERVFSAYFDGKNFRTGNQKVISWFMTINDKNRNSL